jgi:hypothetical protein
MRRLGNQSQTLEEFLEDGAGVPPDDHPHAQLYRNVTPVWHGGESPEELEDRIGDGYSCGFAAGYESGLISAVLKPEWTVGWYHKLRDYYLANDHTPEDLMDWERLAEATTRAIPVSAFDSDRAAPGDSLATAGRMIATTQWEVGAGAVERDRRPRRCCVARDIRRDPQRSKGVRHDFES